MTPQQPLEITVFKLDHNKLEHRRMISQLIDQHRSELQQAILSKGATSDAARKAQATMRALEKKIERITTSLQRETAVAHIACKVKTDNKGKKEATPVGFIFSHCEIMPPLDKHIAELWEAFPELNGLSQAELTKRVLSGEHGYVVPEDRNRGIATRLLKEHEKHATEPNGSNKTGFTHRMISLWGPEAHLEGMLEKQGYKQLAVRKSGAVIMAKKLGTA